MFPRPARPWTASRCLSAQEVGVNLTNGYNGHLIFCETGSVSGQMVKNGTPERTNFYIRKSRIKEGYCDNIRYIVQLIR